MATCRLGLVEMVSPMALSSAMRPQIVLMRCFKGMTWSQRVAVSCRRSERRLLLDLGSYTSSKDVQAVEQRSCA
jgi:hypothetical protein